VFGWSDTLGVRVAVVWTAATGLHRLPGLEHEPALDKEASSVQAINHRHQAVGGILTSGGATEYVIWSLPTP